MGVLHTQQALATMCSQMPMDMVSTSPPNTHPAQAMLGLLSASWGSVGAHCLRCLLPPGVHICLGLASQGWLPFQYQR